jgi:hypothetical protein
MGGLRRVGLVVLWLTAHARGLSQVSTGVTLRENNLKEIQGGKIMESQGVLVGNRAALLERPKLLAIVHELIERFEAHLTAGVAHMHCVTISKPHTFSKKTRPTLIFSCFRPGLLPFWITPVSRHTLVCLTCPRIVLYTMHNVLDTLHMKERLNNVLVQCISLV